MTNNTCKKGSWVNEERRRRLMYSKPEAIVIDLTDDEALVALARCNGGAYSPDYQSCS